MTHRLTDTVTFRHGATVSGRIVMAPMLTLSGLEGGFASDTTLDYYGARSQAAGMLITEFHYVSETGGPASTPGFPEQLGAYDDEHLDSLAAIAQALKKDGNKAILQIVHGGRIAIGRTSKGKEVFVPSKMDFSFRSYDNAHEMTQEEIEEVIKDFGRVTKRAIKAGFDGVEIHGANHYLNQQFFSSTTNIREDKWGGSLEKRMTFPLEVIKEVKGAIGEEGIKNFILGYRISPEEIHDDTVGYDYRDSQALAAEIVKHELDYIHLSLLGGYDSAPKNSDKTYAQLFKEVLDEETKLIIVGHVTTEESARDAVEHYSDFIAVGRGTLIDPQFGQKIKEGKGDTIVSSISPEQLKQTHWTPGLLETISSERFNSRMPIPGYESILHLHTGKYDE